MSRDAKSRDSVPQKKVFLVDDHAVVRQGLTALIEQEEDLFICGEAESAEDALKALGATAPDVCVVDLSLTGIDGIEFVKRARARFPDLRMIILSMHDETLYAERALRAGAMGYIMKRESTEKLLKAIRQVLAGEVSVSERTSGRVLRRLVGGDSEVKISAVEALTDRELGIFRLIGEGLGTRQIADRLHLSIKTIESHRANIMRKLDLSASTELVRRAVQWMSEGH